MGACEECGASYAPSVPWQRFCTTRCERRHNGRRLREQRAAEGLCTKCAAPLDTVTAKFGAGRVRDPDRGPRHCEACRRYWREYRRKQKAPS